MKILFLVTISIASITPCRAGNESLVGTWSLVSMEKQEANGQWVARCPSPNGLITYTNQGYMAVGINCMKAEGSNEPSSEIKDGIFYTGTYVFKGNLLSHQVLNSSDPIFYQKELSREVQFNRDGSITLVGKGKTGMLVRLVWKRAQSKPLIFRPTD